MTREERVKAAIEQREVDRIPVSVWMHFSKYDQDPRSLAEASVEFNEKFDFDFIKMMPFGAYTIPDWGAKLDIYADKYKEVEIAAPGIECLDDYKRIEPLPPTYGTWGKTLQLAQWMNRLVKPNTPYIQTIFSPVTILKKLMGYGPMLRDMAEHPEVVHTALQAITETNLNFIKANIEAGVSGFFFATQLANYDLMSDVMYAEFCKPYDLQILNSYKDKTWFNVVHIHGANIRFDDVMKYPCTVLNWHDRQTAPSLKEAREKTDKTFLGGLYEGPAIIGSSLQYDSILSREGVSPIDVERHIHEAIDMVNGKGIIIGPGCVADPRSSDENIMAVRKAVER